MKPQATAARSAQATALKDILRRDKPDQVCVIVPDLADGIRTWSNILGITDWRVFTYAPEEIKDKTYRGEPSDFTMKIALAGESPQFELIEPATGPSIYHEWVEQHGYGLHHLGFFVESLDEAMIGFEQAGIPVIQTGRGYGLDGDGGFAYVEFDGVVLEALEAPRRRRPSDPLPDGL